VRPLAVDLVLLRSTAPDLPLAVGRVLAARVVERHGRHGVINLAGAYLTAELPEEVQAGDSLRLVVQEARGDQVVLALAPDRRRRRRRDGQPATAREQGEERPGSLDVYG